MSQLDNHNVTVTIPLVSGGTVAAGTTTQLIMAMPGTAEGGGITITKLTYCANAAVASGSAPAFNLVTKTSTGAVIATIGANGSAGLTAGTPIAGTVSTAWVAGTVGYLALEVGHGAYGAATTVSVAASLQYLMGRGSA